MHKLTEAEQTAALQAAPGWALQNGKLTRDWRFSDFVEAMEFVNQVALLAEAAGHHPDIDVRYNHVQLGLVTHDAGGITTKDAEMAARLSRSFPVS